jgi:membrane protease YdiL (CAAX protease family)
VKSSRSLINLFLIPATILPGIASLFYFVWCRESSFAQGLYFGTKIFTLVWPLIACFFVSKIVCHPEQSEGSPSNNNLKKGLFASLRMTFANDQGMKSLFAWRSIKTGLIYGILILLFMLGLTYTPLMEVIRASSGTMRQKAMQLGFYDHFILFAIFLSLIHSLLEEYYWRWFVYGWARKIMKPRWAIILASLAFGFHHFVVTIQYFPLAWAIAFGFAVVFGGAIWCWMYEKQQTILGAWISHIFADVGIMLVGYQLLFQK